MGTSWRGAGGGPVGVNRRAPGQAAPRPREGPRGGTSPHRPVPLHRCSPRAHPAAFSDEALHRDERRTLDRLITRCEPRNAEPDVDLPPLRDLCRRQSPVRHIDSGPGLDRVHHAGRLFRPVVGKRPGGRDRQPRAGPDRGGRGRPRAPARWARGRKPSARPAGPRSVQPGMDGIHTPVGALPAWDESETA